MDAQEYRARILANRIADLEFDKATLVTENQQLRQNIQQLEEMKSNGAENQNSG